MKPTIGQPGKLTRRGLAMVDRFEHYDEPDPDHPIELPSGKMIDLSDCFSLLQTDKEELLSLPRNETCTALVELVLSGVEPTEALRVCLDLADHPCLQVRTLVTTCLGHLARLHNDLDLSAALKILERFSEDLQTKGYVNNAWEDIEQYSTWLRSSGR